MNVTNQHQSLVESEIRYYFIRLTIELLIEDKWRKPRGKQEAQRSLVVYQTGVRYKRVINVFLLVPFVADMFHHWIY